MPPFLHHARSGQRTASSQGSWSDPTTGSAPHDSKVVAQLKTPVTATTALMNFPTTFPGRRVKRPGFYNRTIALVLLTARFLAITFSRQRFLHPALFTGLQIVGMTLDFLNYVFLLDLPFEPAQGVFKRLPLLQPNFGQV